jgi:hypothetical protein
MTEPISNTDPSNNQPVIDISNEIYEKHIIQLSYEKDSTVRDINSLWTLQEELLEKLTTQKRELHDKQRFLAMKHRKEIMDFDLECLEIENQKMSRYLDVLKKKHEIEISYLDEMYKYKKSITDISNANSDVDIKVENIPNIQETFNFELVKIFPMKKKRSNSLPITGIQQNTIIEPQNVINPVTPMNMQSKTQSRPPPPPPQTQTQTQSEIQVQEPFKRAHINISNLDRTRLKKPEQTERRHSMPGNLESHLREALTTKFAGVFETMKSDGVIDDSDDEYDKWN